MKSGGRKWERERGLSIREDHLPLQRSPSSYLLGRKCPANLEHGLSHSFRVDGVPVSTSSGQHTTHVGKQPQKTREQGRLDRGCEHRMGQHRTSSATSRFLSSLPTWRKASFPSLGFTVMGNWVLGKDLFVDWLCDGADGVNTSTLLLNVTP